MSKGIVDIQILTIDPPWPYNGGRKPEDRFGLGVEEILGQTLNWQELAELPVREVLADDALVFLFATFPFLNRAVPLFDIWGLTYVTAPFVWVKCLKPTDEEEELRLRKGRGRYTQSNAQPVLLGRKGKPIDPSAMVGQVVVTETLPKLRKPDEIRQGIYAMYPRRQYRHGWWTVLHKDLGFELVVDPDQWYDPDLEVE